MFLWKFISPLFNALLIVFLLSFVQACTGGKLKDDRKEERYQISALENQEQETQPPITEPETPPGVTGEILSYHCQGKIHFADFPEYNLATEDSILIPLTPMAEGGLNQKLILDSEMYSMMLSRTENQISINFYSEEEEITKSLGTLSTDFNTAHLTGEFKNTAGDVTLIADCFKNLKKDAVVHTQEFSQDLHLSCTLEGLDKYDSESPYEQINTDLTLTADLNSKTLLEVKNLRIEISKTLNDLIITQTLMDSFGNEENGVKIAKTSVAIHSAFLEGSRIDAAHSSYQVKTNCQVKNQESGSSGV